MRQFTAEDVKRLRERADAGDIIRFLGDQIQDVREHFLVPKTGIATWQGFFACPKHSVDLRFDISDPKHYVCPVDGEVFAGQPYEGAWWRILNGKNQAACHQSALLWLLTGEGEYLELSRRLLAEYAAYYPGYEVHGGIPYNNPGKANAQTLCDAMWIKGLCLGYDIIRDALSEQDRALIEEQLLRPCGEFLMRYRMDQIHNHEVIADSSVGMLGLLLENGEFLSFALDSKYGLRYQLEHGVLADGFWFEGTPSYHFFAMEQYLQFELFARRTEHSFLKDAHFLDILKFPLRLIQPDERLPLVGDAGSGNTGFDGTECIYEMAYAETKDPDLARILHLLYRNKPRGGLYAYFFGAQELPPEVPAGREDYHCGESGGSGLTVMHGPDGRYLLVKHSPYGGEHDHYDRLGLHFMACGQYAAPDLGTCLYGAPMHYDYYKNTASHNTVCLDGENQPPANAETLRYERGEGRVLLDTRVKWDGAYPGLDSFTIPQWSEEAYRGAEFRRVIIWYGDFFVDLFRVRSPQEHDIDWTLHVRGERAAAPGERPERERWNDHGAGRFLHGVVRAESAPVTRTDWFLGGGVCLSAYGLTDEETGVFYAMGPDNPSVREVSYQIERKRGTQALFVHVISAWRQGAPVLAGVSGEVREGRVSLTVRRAGEAGAQTVVIEETLSSYDQEG